MGRVHRALGRHVLPDDPEPGAASDRVRTLRRRRQDRYPAPLGWPERPARRAGARAAPALAGRLSVARGGSRTARRWIVCGPSFLPRLRPGRCTELVYRGPLGRRPVSMLAYKEV